MPLSSTSSSSSSPPTLTPCFGPHSEGEATDFLGGRDPSPVVRVTDGVRVACAISHRLPPFINYSTSRSQVNSSPRSTKTPGTPCLSLTQWRVIPPQALTCRPRRASAAWASTGHDRCRRVKTSAGLNKMLTRPHI